MRARPPSLPLSGPQRSPRGSGHFPARGGQRRAMGAARDGGGGLSPQTRSAETQARPGPWARPTALPEPRAERVGARPVTCPVRQPLGQPASLFWVRVDSEREEQSPPVSRLPLPPPPPSGRNKTPPAEARLRLERQEGLRRCRVQRFFYRAGTLMKDLPAT